MIKKSIFREYDIRGIVGEELNEQSVKLIGFYLGQEIVKTNGSRYVAVGYDARTHSPTLFNYLVSGLNKAGCKVFGMGMVTTGVNYFTSYNEFHSILPNASIMITGSHNPSEYNGFKITIEQKPFFGKDLYALGEKVVNNQNMAIPDNTKYIEIDAKSEYINFITKEFAHLKGKLPKIAIDCGNGVANTVLGDILDNLEAKYEMLYGTPDGTFPNHHPDPSEEKNLQDLKKILVGDIKYGFAYDGDADRIAVLTQKNNVKGDILALFFAKSLTNPVVVGEVKCSSIMYDGIKAMGGEAIMYKTGHSNIKVKMKEVNADFGAEVSGHIFFKDRFFGFDDAIYVTFRVLELIADGLDIDAEIAKLPKIYSTDELKIKTTENKKFAIIESIKEKLKNPPSNFPDIKEIVDVDGLRIIFEDGWALVRASNTTPVLVTRFESTKKENLELYEKLINGLIE